MIKSKIRLLSESCLDNLKEFEYKGKTSLDLRNSIIHRYAISSGLRIVKGEIRFQYFCLYCLRQGYLGQDKILKNAHHYGGMCFKTSDKLYQRSVQNILEYGFDKGRTLTPNFQKEEDFEWGSEYKQKRDDSWDQYREQKRKFPSRRRQERFDYMISCMDNRLLDTYTDCQLNVLERKLVTIGSKKPFEMNVSQFAICITMPCFYLDYPPDDNLHSCDRWISKRNDETLPYSIENVVPASHMANMGKSGSQPFIFIHKYVNPFRKAFNLPALSDDDWMEKRKQVQESLQPIKDKKKFEMSVFNGYLKRHSEYLQ